MSWKLRAAMSALLLAPQAAFALGLGDIRVSSALNEPLSAEIELVAPTAEELGSMGAQLASREMFQRYGLDRPAFLDSMQFNVGRGRDGRNVLLVTSTAPASEPFVTFLVELNWPRGRLLREYTVLLDPPVFAPSEAAPPAPVAAPRVSRPAAAPTSEPVPAPAPAPRPTPAPAAPAAVAPPSADGAPSTYRVRRGDTAYGIAARFSGGDRAATNRTMIAMYRANPDAFGGNVNLLLAGAILRVPGPEAVNAVGAQEAVAEISRQNSAWRTGEALPETGRLRLVTPSEAAPEVAPAADLESRIGQLNREVEESKRLLEIRQAELAQLQARLAEQEAAARAAAAAAPAEAPLDAAAPAEAPAGEPPAPAVAAEPAAAAPEAPPAAAPEAPSFLDSLTDNWTYMLGAAALLLGGGLAWGYVRRRREEDLDEALRSFEMPDSAPLPSEAQRLRSLAMAEHAAAEDIVVEERKPAAKAAAKPAARRRAEEKATDETISTEVALDLDESDPLAEADFHMAYGLYDQSADIMHAALEKEPGRRDFKVKLLEVYFVSGNAEGFLEIARDLSQSRTEGDAAEWDRIVIMGRQLAADDPLFEGAGPSGGVDLNLEGGENRVDIELLQAPEGGEDEVDLDLGEALGGADSSADTGENTALDMDFDQADTEAVPPTVELPRMEPTVEMPTMELPAGDAPTVETPRMREGTSDTVRHKVGAGKKAPVSEDATAELAMDDLGIDLGDLGAMDEDESTRLMPKDEERAAGGTAVLPALADDADEGATAVLKGLDADLSEIDLELPEDRGGAEGETQRIDLDIGKATDDDASATARMSLSDLPQMSELEPVTMSEVGTKLDLARAYVDMGDPDGARSILQEVLQEGSSQQKQDAQRLLDSLPGA